MLKISSTMKM